MQTTEFTKRSLEQPVAKAPLHGAEDRLAEDV